MRIGLLSDTHIPEAGRDLWDEVYEAFRGTDAILHAGDITVSRVLDRLEEIAPVYAAEGNHDQHLTDAPRIRPVHRLMFEGHTVALLHQFEPFKLGIDGLVARWLDGDRVDVVVHGDSHRERIIEVDGMLLVNPGSPTLPRNLSSRLGHIGFLTLERGRPPRAEIVDLAGGRNDRLMQGHPDFT